MAGSKLRWVWWMLCLVLLPAVARAQDVFNAGNPANTFSDAFSSSCLQAQKPNIWKQIGLNPLTCSAQTMGQDANGQCTLKGATMLAHQGGTCYYCVPMKPPADIYIPVDQGPNANSQGYTCGNSPVDPGCMMACFKQFKSTGEYVPPGVQPITGGTGTPAPGGVPLTATTSSDPCHPNYNLSTPAGQAAMQANAARDAAACNASRCQHNPQLTVCTSVGGGPGAALAAVATAAAECVSDNALPPISWPANDVAVLGAALKNARDMLSAAKAHTDQATWDAATQAAAVKFFGNASAATQTAVRARVDGAYGLLSQMSTTNQSFYPAQNVANPAMVAYVHPNKVNVHPVIFLANQFWAMSATGPDSQATTIVHELSHYLAGGGTGDVVYGQGACEQLAINPTLLQALSAWRLPADTPLTNADSFGYFVYYASHPQ